MNWLEVRNNIITALNTVEGITANTSPNTKVGSAWVRLGPRAREDGWWIATYYVYVIVPQKPEEADVWADSKDDLLLEAINDTGIAYVTNFDNVELPTQSGTAQLALLITLRST